MASGPFCRWFPSYSALIERRKRAFIILKESLIEFLKAFPLYQCRKMETTREDRSLAEMKGKCDMLPKLINERACVVLFTAALMCLACMEANGVSEAGSADSQQVRTGQLPPGQGLAIGADAPAFSLPDGEGNPHALADHRGKELVLVFYRTGT